MTIKRHFVPNRRDVLKAGAALAGAAWVDGAGVLPAAAAEFDDDLHR